MRGYEALIAMRRQGAVPADVHLDTEPNDTWRWWHQSMPHHACVLVEPGESIGLLDLRFLVGLTVHVHGSNENRVRELFDACVQAKAARVVAFDTLELDSKQ